MRIFVTGFGAFGGIQDNPSALLAQTSGCPHEVLPVTFEAVTAFAKTFNPDLFDALVMLGVNTLLGELQVEMVAHNVVGSTPDASGVRWTSKEVVPGGPGAIGSNLWNEREDYGELVGQSYDAGSYLCNFLYYQMRQRHPRLRSGFLHVPLFETLGNTLQQAALQDIFRRLT